MNKTIPKAKFIAVYSLFSKTSLEKHSFWKRFATADTLEEIEKKIEEFKKEKDNKNYMCRCRVVEYSEERGYYITIKDECKGYERTSLPAS